MYKCIIALTALFTATSMAAPAWTWVDENGRRHFSDLPVEGAIQIELTESQTFSRGVSTAAPAAPAAAAQPEPAETLPYTVFNVTSPTHQETLWNIGGNLSMALDLQPALQNGHRIDVVLDGEQVEIGARSPTLTIPEVFRGAHTLQAVIMDATGREVLRSLAITVMVQQTSLQNPNGVAGNSANN